MRTFACLWMMLWSAGALALVDTFDARAKAAAELERRAVYRDFQTAVFQRIGADLASAVNRCATTTPQPDTRPFALVVDIDQRGRTYAVSLRPDTNVARCMADAFRTFSFPKPPPKGPKTVPLLFNLNIAP